MPEILRSVFDALPDVAGILLAALSLSLIFLPKELRKLEEDKWRWLRWTLAVVFAAIGVGGVVSNAIQKSQDKSARIAQQRATEAWEASTTEKLNAILNNPASSAEQKQAATKLKRQIEQPHLALDIGQTRDAHYAFETRFTLRNPNPLPVKDAVYRCQIMNPLDPADVRATMPGLNPQITLHNSAASGPIGDLPSGKSHSLYCDYSMDLFANKIPSPQIEIWIFYKYSNREAKDGFRFLALRSQDGTYMWLPRGGAEP